MKEFDFGYFGTGDAGYAQYMTAFERNFGAEPDDTAERCDDADDISAEDEDF